MSLSPEPLEARQQRGFWLWCDRLEGVEVRFVGAGPPCEREDLPAELGEVNCAGVAWAKQVHGTGVLPAHSGFCGEGDALWSRQPGLAVSVITADCVPVVLAGDGMVAAVHAGWRGIAADIVGATLASLAVEAHRLAAWIGPAIGPCCYEVSDDVAAQVEHAASDRTLAAQPSTLELSVPGPNGRPHLNLVAAVEAQLRRCGVLRVRRARACTRCDSERLASYRRQGKGGGRNVALAWLTSKL